MNKKILIVSVFVLLLFTGFAVASKPEKPDPLESVWAVISTLQTEVQNLWTTITGIQAADTTQNQQIATLQQTDQNLQNEINNVQLIPGPQGPKGEPGIQGPIGPHGPSGQTGAGNIAFIDGQSVLTTDGQVWTSISDLQTYTWSWKSEHMYDVPMHINQIVSWKVNSILDVNGHVWIPFGSGWIDLNSPTYPQSNTNLALNKTTSASVNPETANGAVDGDITTFDNQHRFATITWNNQSWWAVDLNSETQIGRIVIYTNPDPQANANTKYFPTRWHLTYSLNGTQWTRLLTGDNYQTAKYPWEYSFNPINARFLKVTADFSNQGQSWYIQEFMAFSQ